MNNTILLIAGTIAATAWAEAENTLPEEARERPSAPIRDVLAPPRPGNARLHGIIGQEIDNAVNARILSKKAEEDILPEAIEAFKRRMDDRFHEGRGTWQGEFWGKWTLSAVAAQRYTGDDHLKQLIRKGADQLIATRRNDGYIGTYQDSAFVTGNCWNVWCRKYTLWGLLAAYELLEDPKILSAAEGLVDQLMTEVGPGRTDIVKTGNFAGLPSSSILTPMIKLYRHTNDPDYLQYAEYIVKQWSKYPDTPPDIVNKGLTGEPIHSWFPKAGRWTKAYEFISCVEGMLDLYRVNGDEALLRSARNIHKAIRQNERVITGGIGYHDKLDHAAVRTDGLNEPCDVVYWERLSTELLRLTGEPEYADEIERLAYNVLIASMNRDGSWGLRRLGLSEPHLIAPLHCYMYNHQCCVANVPRGLLQLARTTVMTDPENPGIAVNLFIPGTASVSLPSGDTIKLRVETSYPEDGAVRLTVVTEKALPFELKLRIPPWSRNTRVKVNDRDVDDTPVPGSYVTLPRTWHSRDTIQLLLDMTPRLVPSPGSSSHFAVMRGPVVLARSSLLETKEEIHEPVRLRASEEGTVELKSMPAPPGVWMAFEATLTDGKKIRLCDYASTGKDYTKPADPKAKKMMRDNRTGSGLRVWLEQPNR